MQITGNSLFYIKKGYQKKINKRGVSSIAVSNTKQSNTCTQIEALYPQHSSIQVLAHGLLATRAK